MHIPTGPDDAFILTSMQPDAERGQLGSDQWQVPKCAHVHSEYLQVLVVMNPPESLSGVGTSLVPVLEHQDCARACDRT